MTSEQFTYWLQGWFELNKTIDHRKGASEETLKMIEDHLKTVFHKVTPDYKEPIKVDSDIKDIRWTNPDYLFKPTTIC